MMASSEVSLSKIAMLSQEIKATVLNKWQSQHGVAEAFAKHGCIITEGREAGWRLQLRYGSRVQSSSGGRIRVNT